MSYMFIYAGYDASSFNIGDLSKKTVTVNGNTYTAWNTSNVTDMSYMFHQAGYNASFYLNCSNWDVSKVTSHDNFNTYLTSDSVAYYTTKIAAPQW